MANRENNEKLWAEAKKRCRLNSEEIGMAKKLGMNPRSLIKNIPSPSERWKASVKVWVRDLYGKRFKETVQAGHPVTDAPRRPVPNHPEKAPPEKSYIWDPLLEDLVESPEPDLSSPWREEKNPGS
jgi:hypothetical protein